jgi:hypothetical protein
MVVAADFGAQEATTRRLAGYSSSKGTGAAGNHVDYMKIGSSHYSSLTCKEHKGLPSRWIDRTIHFLVTCLCDCCQAKGMVRRQESLVEMQRAAEQQAFNFNE